MFDNILFQQSINEIICSRCKIKPADFRCLECNKHGWFCANCDGYLHSLPSKRNHSRTMISNLSTQELKESPISYSPQNGTFYTNHQSKTISNDNVNVNVNTTSTSKSTLHQQPILASSPQYITNNCVEPSQTSQTSQTQAYINKIKEIYEKEKEDLIEKIANLNAELKASRKSMNDRVDYLHSHWEETNYKHLKEIESVNSAHWNEMNSIINEKDSEISSLYLRLNEQEHIIKDLEFKINNISSKYNNDKDNLIIEIQRLNKDINAVSEAKGNDESYFKTKFDEIIHGNEMEKQTIIKSYELSIEKLNEGYLKSKEKYCEIIQQREDYIKELIANSKKDNNELNSIIDKLKECNDTWKTDQEEWMKMNETWRNTLVAANNELEEVKKENKVLREEKGKWMESVEELREEKNNIEKKHDKLHEVMYGKFSALKNNKK